VVQLGEAWSATVALEIPPLSAEVGGAATSGSGEIPAGWIGDVSGPISEATNSVATNSVSIGNSGYKSIGEFTDAVTERYQALYDQHYSGTMQLAQQGLIPNNSLTIGIRVDALVRTDLRDWIINGEGLQEGPGQIIQINRRLYDPAGSGAYRVPDVYVSGSQTILDGSLSFKTSLTPQVVDFGTFSGGANVTIIRPASLPPITLTTPFGPATVSGSYGVVP
jgi:hypothetical protein